MDRRYLHVAVFVGSIVVLVAIGAAVRMSGRATSEVTNGQNTATTREVAARVEAAQKDFRSPVPLSANIPWKSGPTTTVATAPIPQLSPSVFANSASTPISPSHPSNGGGIRIPKASLTARGSAEEKVKAGVEIAPQMPKFVLSLCCDARGNIWVGTEDEGVFRFDVGEKTWTRFSVKDGLGDNYGYAIACDSLGRIWVGHLNHGVSVFNGERWQCYEVAGGLSRPDTLSGPLGERVFDIATCPVDGDVWVSGNCGLARYSESSKRWAFYTQAEGLPSNQIQSMAFDRNGNLYCGTQCDGITIASRGSDYKVWTQVKSQEDLPSDAQGSGIPTNAINDLLVAKDGTVYSGTIGGLAWSKDDGVTWRYVRGANWIAKAHADPGFGARSAKSEQDAAWLPEDFVNCLAECSDGSIAIGFRQQGWIRFDPRSGKLGDGIGTKGEYINAILPVGKIAAIASYGKTFALPNFSPDSNPSRPTVDERHPLPIGAEIGPAGSAPTTDAPTTAKIVYIGEDWVTGGDWLGRYGTLQNILCAMMAPFDQQISRNRTDTIRGSIGPNHEKGDDLRHWIHWKETTNEKSLYNPIAGVRRQAEWDDHGESYPMSAEGPDLWADVVIPEGVHRVAFYFFNKDGHDSEERYRDYILEGFDCRSSQAIADHSKVVARTRVTRFWGGVYKQFAVEGPGSFSFRVRRNHSLNTILSGIFVDRLSTPVSRFERSSIPWLGGLQFNDPVMDLPPISNLPNLAANASLRSSAMRQKLCMMANYQAVQRMEYRQASASELDKTVLASLRWRSLLWNKEDRVDFVRTMKLGWDRQVKLTPNLVATSRPAQ